MCGYGISAEAMARRVPWQNALGSPAGMIMGEAGLKKDYKYFNESFTGPLVQFASA